jgi:hypothetical protein
MDRYKIHKVVEYIRSREEFPFDVEDVEESLPVVLGYFKLNPEVNGEERNELQAELKVLARVGEMGEVARLVEAEDSSLLAGLRPYRQGCYREPSISAGDYIARIRQE